MANYSIMENDEYNEPSILFGDGADIFNFDYGELVAESECCGYGTRIVLDEDDTKKLYEKMKEYYKDK